MTSEAYVPLAAHQERKEKFENVMCGGKGWVEQLAVLPCQGFVR
jgi:hypothetical protein